MYRHSFESLDRVDWLRSICEVRKRIVDNRDSISFVFDEIPALSIRPEHLVSFACLIEEMKKTGVRAYIYGSPNGHAIRDGYNLYDYWSKNLNYSRASDQTVLNLQRVIEKEKDFHAIRVAEYLQNKFFHKKDLSPVSSSLTEVYYNIFDHANANGNAFSMLSFDQVKEELHVAVCDFGIGIARSVKNYFHDNDMDDAVAIEKAMENNFTIGSTSHNSGQGLGNILSSCTEKDTLWIVSNTAAIATNSFGRKVKRLDFDFEGTLIFYSLSLPHFEDEEVLEEFDL